MGQGRTLVGISEEVPTYDHKDCSQLHPITVAPNIACPALVWTYDGWKHIPVSEYYRLDAEIKADLENNGH